MRKSSGLSSLCLFVLNIIDTHQLRSDEVNTMQLNAQQRGFFLTESLRLEGGREAEIEI